MLKEYGNDIGNFPATDNPLLYLLSKATPNLPEDKLKEKQRKFGEDSESLSSLLKHKGEKPTWEQVQLIRQYTVNFNPAFEHKILLLTSPLQPGQGTGDEVNTSTS
jgi:hypothetical protein